MDFNRILVGLSYPRSYIMSLFAAILTGVVSALVVAIAGILRSRKLAAMVIMYGWARPSLWLNGVKVEVRGVENLPTGPKGFLILFNHSSHADILVLYGYFPKFFNFGAKIELFKIPIFGAAMKIVGTLPIDRGDRKKVMQIYDEAIARVNKGHVFALAPEGTRQNEPHLGKFKRGPFEFAINAKMDIVPVLIAGAIEVLPRDSVWFNQGKWNRKVILQILPSVSTQMLNESDFEELQDRVRNLMAPAYSALNNELGVKC